MKLKKGTGNSLLVCLLVMGLSGTVFAELTVCQKAYLMYGFKVASCTKENLADDIYHYRILLRVGDGFYDKIGIHRVVREEGGSPITADDAVFMVHGDTADFESAFLMSTKSDNAEDDQSLAMYMASNDMDVWGIDLRWTNVPRFFGNTRVLFCTLNGCDFMEDWDTETHLSDIETALDATRAVRAATGSDSGKVFMLGHSRGAQFVYAYANQESTVPEKKRDVKGIIPIDLPYKLDPAETALVQEACERQQVLQAIIDSGQYYSDEAVTLKLIALLAKTAPDAESLVMPGYTNMQVALLALSATYATYEPPMSPPTPFYHYCAGEFDMETGMPLGLQFTDFDYMLDFAFAVPSFQSLGEMLEGEAILCSDETAYDDNLGDITVPVYYVGAAGGMGEYGTYTTTLLGSSDVSTNIVTLYPAEYAAVDYGHIDLLYAENAEGLVWEPIADWIGSH